MPTPLNKDTHAYFIWAVGQSLTEGQGDFSTVAGGSDVNSFGSPTTVTPLFTGHPFYQYNRTFRLGDTNVWEPFSIDDGNNLGRIYHKPDMFMGMAINKWLEEEFGDVSYFMQANSALSAKPYNDLKKPQSPYTNGQVFITTSVYGQREGLRTVGLSTQYIGHGENDTAANVSIQQYLNYLLEWRRDFETDAGPNSTRLSRSYIYQTNSHTFYNSTTPRGPSKAQLRAHTDYSSKFTLFAPNYFLPYTDGVHLTKLGYWMLGHYAAKAWYSENIDGARWEPVRPKAAWFIDSTHVAIRFHVPVAPLVLDDSVVSDPGNYGFEYEDGGSAAISSVAVDANRSDTVILTLDGARSGAGTVRYAWTGTSGADAGPATGARGCLRDSDATETITGATYDNAGVEDDALPAAITLRNYCVSFEQSVQ